MVLIDVPVRRLARAFGFDVERKRPVVADLLARHRIDLVLDVGANVGQYGARLRAWGYGGRIVSFEPLRDAFAELERRTARDPGWSAVPVALGDADGPASIHVSEKSVFSSLRRAHPALQGWYRESATIGTEEVAVRRLDGLFPALSGGAREVFLKIDTQGYEREVLRGAEESLRAIRGVQLEASLTALYEGEAMLEEILRVMAGYGFAPAGLEPVVYEPAALSLLQVDCVFLRQDPAP